jgi:farnesyl diphosphate synthase
VLIPEQDNYGKKDSTCEARIKDIFSQSPISLPERFEAYEKESHAKLLELIGQVDEDKTGMKRAVFVSFLEKVYKRSK